MLVFIGSVALNKYRSVPKPTNDVDAIADYDTAAGFLKSVGCIEMYPINDGKTLYGRNKTTIFEIEIAWPESTAESFLQLMQSRMNIQPISGYGAGAWFPSLNMLYTLKMSHRYLRNSPHFLKTRNDILEMRQMGAKIPDEYRDWYLTRKKATYWYQLPNLNRTKDEFFLDQYQYDHDSIHEAVAIYSRPAYTFYDIEGAEVLSSKDRFYAQPDAIRLAGVVEEASVLALERSLIPFPGAMSEDKAFEFALQKVCTSITSGWFREYAWENYDEALKLYRSRDVGLNTLLRDGVNAGIVKRNENYVGS